MGDYTRSISPGGGASEPPGGQDYWRNTLLSEESVNTLATSGSNRLVLGTTESGSSTSSGSALIVPANEYEDDIEEESVRDSVHLVGGCLPCKPKSSSTKKCVHGCCQDRCSCSSMSSVSGAAAAVGSRANNCSSKWCCGVVASTVKKTAKKF